jgi:hypothetical protein
MFNDSRLGLEELGDVTELIISRYEQFGRRDFLEARVVFLQAGIEQGGGRFVVAVGSAFGLRDNAVNAAQFA